MCSVKCIPIYAFSDIDCSALDNLVGSVNFSGTLQSRSLVVEIAVGVRKQCIENVVVLCCS